MKPLSVATVPTCLCSSYAVLRRLHGCNETKRPINVIYVVVNRLGDARHGHVHFGLQTGLMDLVGGAVRAVPANHVQVLNVLFVQKRQNLVDVKAPARRPQDGPTFVVDVFDHFVRQ